MATDIGKSAKSPPVAGQNHRGSSDDTPVINDLEEGTNRSAIEALGLGAVLFAGIQGAKTRFPAIARLPNSNRTLITVGPPVLWYLYSNVASARNNKKARLHAQHSPNAGSSVYTQGADMTQQRLDLGLSLPQRAAMFCVDNPLPAIGAFAAPLAGYAIYANSKFPGIPVTQKVMRSSVAGQITVLSTLGIVALLSYNYEPPHEHAKATLRKHMTAVRPAGEAAAIARRRTTARAPQQQQQPQEQTH